MTKVHYGTQIPPLFLESAGPLYRILVSLPPETVNFSVLICFDEGWIRIKYVEFFFGTGILTPSPKSFFSNLKKKTVEVGFKLGSPSWSDIHY